MMRGTVIRRYMVATGDWFGITSAAIVKVTSLDNRWSVGEGVPQYLLRHV